MFPDKNLLVSSESRLNCCNPRTKDLRVLNIEQRVQPGEIVYLLLSHEGRVQIRLRTVGNKEGKYSPESVVSENSRTLPGYSKKLGVHYWRSLEKVPLLINYISDNGPFYHNFAPKTITFFNLLRQNAVDILNSLLFG